jgi:hypothetical protein
MFDKENRMLCELQERCFPKAGVEVFNVNPESACTAFPYVPFNDAIDDCKGLVPREPFDMVDWYSKKAKTENKQRHPGMITAAELYQTQKEDRSGTQAD